MDINKYLTYEAFGLMNDKQLSAMKDLREQGAMPEPLNLSEEEINAFKEVADFFTGGLEKPSDYAKLFTFGQNTKDFITDPDNLAMAGATVGGIVLPSTIPYYGQLSIPARVIAVADKYPRLARIINSFIGGTLGSSPFVDSPMEAAQYGAMEAGGESIMQVLGKAWPFVKSKIQSLIKKKAVPGAEQAVKEITEAGGIVTPAQITKNRIIDTVENLVSNSWIGGEAIQEAKEEAVELATGNINKHLMSKYGSRVNEIANKNVDQFINELSKDDMNLVLKEFLERGSAVHDLTIKQGYKNLDRIIDRTIGNIDVVDISGLKVYAKKLAEVDPGDEALASFYKAVAKQPDKVSFEYASRLRSLFLGKTKAFAETGVPRTDFSAKVAGEGMAIVDRQMMNAVNNISKNLDENVGKNLNDAFRDANAFYRMSKETFNNIEMVKLVNGKPDLIYQNLISAKKPEQIKKFLNLITDQAVKDGVLPNKLAAEKLVRKVQGEFFVDILGKSIDPETGVLLPNKLLNQIRNFGGRGQRAINELFSNNPEILQQFKDLTRSLQIVTKKGIEGGIPGGMFIQLVQAGAIGEQLFLDAELDWKDGATFGLLFGGPKVVSKLFTDPNFIKGIFNVNKSKVGSQFYTRSVVQVVNDLLTNDLISREDANTFIERGIDNEYLTPNAQKFMEQNKKAGGSDKSSYTPSDEEIQAKSDLFKELGLDRLDTEPQEVEEVAIASTLPTAPPSRSVSMSPLDLGPVTTASAPPSQSINPNTLASLESVGLPFFQAKDGGLASIEPKKFKKPQVVS